MDFSFLVFLLWCLSVISFFPSGNPRWPLFWSVSLLLKRGVALVTFDVDCLWARNTPHPPFFFLFSEFWVENYLKDKHEKKNNLKIIFHVENEFVMFQSLLCSNRRQKGHFGAVIPWATLASSREKTWINCSSAAHYKLKLEGCDRFEFFACNDAQIDWKMKMLRVKTRSFFLLSVIVSSKFALLSCFN